MCKAPFVPPARSATAETGTAQPVSASETRLSVAVDATPLLGRPTGVGVFCAGALGGLAQLDEVDVAAFAISWRRRRGIVGQVPEGVSTRQRAMPARPLHASWRHWALPPLDWFVGTHQVVHGTNFVVPPARRAARVVTVHDLTIVRFPELCDASTLRFPALIRRAVAEGAWVHTPSRFVAAEVIEAFNLPPERVRAVHHGVPRLPGLSGDPGSAPGDPGSAPGHHPPPSGPLVLPSGTARYVLAIGTVEPRKDYPSLVAAFGLMAEDHPDVALVVVGADGWGSEAFQAAVDASPARARIVRPGFLDDAALGRVLRGAAVLAYPSVYEGFGFPPLQAMVEGVPVVTTRVGAIPEVVGDAAVLVEPGAPEALAEALVGVLAGGAEVSDLIERGRLRSQAFTWSACARGLVGLYRDAAAEVGR
jgi:glycosyltransferase involved in cell wall biosynthesis